MYLAPTGRLVLYMIILNMALVMYLLLTSYSDIADQMTFEDIPHTVQQRLIPDAPHQLVNFLTDCYDFRPRVEDIAGTSATLSTTDEITGHSFDFFSRQYDGTGASISNA